MSNPITHKIELSEQDKSFIIAAFRRGYSITCIAKYYYVSRSYMRGLLEEWGVGINEKGTDIPPDEGTEEWHSWARFCKLRGYSVKQIANKLDEVGNRKSINAVQCAVAGTEPNLKIFKEYLK